jgi:apolipoprotein N-acyltransferase
LVINDRSTKRVRHTRRPDKQAADIPCISPPLLSLHVRRIHKSAWLLILLSAVLQVLIFPLPDFYLLSWVAITPLLIALLRTRQPDTLQLQENVKLLPATAWQGFLLAYACGILWYAGTCYWIYNTMRQFGGVNVPMAVIILILFCLYLALYHGLFGLLISLLARQDSAFSRRALLLSPVIWVAVELARTRITGFPWDLLGISQVDNIPLARIATVTGVYGASFEIMVVNSALAAAFLLRRGKTQAVTDCCDRRSPGAAIWAIASGSNASRRTHGSAGPTEHSHPRGL